MKILQRYVLRELMSPLVIGLLVFTFILLVNKLFRLTDLLVSQGVSFWLVGQLLLCLLPTLLTLTIPMSVLVAVLIGFGRLTVDNEILAMRTGGVNLMRLFTPVIGAACIISAGMIAANYSLMPNLLYKGSDLFYRIEFQVLTALEPGRFYDDLGGGDVDLTLYYRERDPKTGEMLGVNMRVVGGLERLTDQQGEEGNTQEGKGEGETVIFASRGRVEAYPEQKAVWIRLFNGSLHPISRHRTTQNIVLFFSELNRTLRPKIGRIKGGVYVKSPKEMTIAELRRALVQPDIEKEERYRILNQLAQRYSIPLACVAFALIGMPLAIYIRPSGKSVGFGVSFGLLFIYYLMLKWGTGWLPWRFFHLICCWVLWGAH
jgi:lipopolysaccharide export system permease protein